MSSILKPNLVDIGLRLQNVKFNEVNEEALYKPKEIIHFTVDNHSDEVLRALRSLNCKFSRKITKNDSSLSLLECEVYTIVRNNPVEGTQVMDWAFNGDEDYDNLVELLKAGWMVGKRTSKDAFMVIFTKEDAEELLLRNDYETGYMGLVKLWFLSTVHAFLEYNNTTPLAFDAFFDTTTDVKGIKGNKVDAVEFFHDVMDTQLNHIFGKLRDLARKNPFSMYAVESRAGGISLARYEDVRVLLFERDRSFREEQARIKAIEDAEAYS